MSHTVHHQSPDADRRPTTADRPHANTWIRVARVASSGWLLGLAWVLSRALMLRSWAHSYTYIIGDPQYYDWELANVHDLSLRMREYPVPVVWFLQFFRWAVHGQSSYYPAAFGIGMAILDAAFTLVLWRNNARASAWYWSAFGFFMGALLWFRFDVLPAVVVGGALLVVVRRPKLNGALVALGAAIKLWPALVLLPLLHPDRHLRRRLASFGIVGFLLTLVSWVAGGTERLVSPLTWQSDRGLQIESLPGSVLVAMYSFTGSTRWNIQLSSYNAFEIYGPGVSTALGISSLLMLAAGVLAVALGVRAWRRPRLDPFDATMGATAVIAAFIVANKTLSPQYMFWLGAPVAVLLHHARTPRHRVRAATLAALVLLVAALTQVVYPGHYSDIIYAVPPDSGITTVLLVRNGLAVLVTVTSAWWALRPGPTLSPPAEDAVPADTGSHPTPEADLAPDADPTPDGARTSGGVRARDAATSPKPEAWPHGLPDGEGA